MTELVANSSQEGVARVKPVGSAVSLAFGGVGLERSSRLLKGRLWRSVLWVLVASSLSPNVCFGEFHDYISRYLISYGACDLIDGNASILAGQYRLIITEWWKNKAVAALKKRNTLLKALFYRDLLGALKSYDDWAELSRHPSWFVRDKNTGQRIRNKKFGWYLMDITNQDYRAHLIQYIITKLSRYQVFDGVFLDDVREEIRPQGFVVDNARNDGVPSFKNSFLIGYRQAVEQLLCDLKKKLAEKMLVINTDDPGYSPFVDGVMLEGFVHASWQDPDLFPPVWKWRCDLLRLVHLQQTGKLILVKSGSRWRPSGCSRTFLFCLASFLLASGSNTSFFFEVSGGPKRFVDFSEYHLALGMPTETVKPKRVWEVAIATPPFSLDSWKLFNKKCLRLCPSDSEGEGSFFCFNNHSGEGCYVCKYIPLPPVSDITISCIAKGNAVEPGDLAWNRFGIFGKFCDRDKKVIESGIDLPFDLSTYPWKTFTARYEVPKKTRYLLIGAMGFLPGSHGAGCIRGLKIAGRPREPVYSREFQKAVVFVNPSRSSEELQLPVPLLDSKGGLVQRVKLAARSGLILQKTQQRALLRVNHERNENRCYDSYKEQ